MTNLVKGGKIVKLSGRGARGIYRRKKSKKLEKTFQKGIDKGKGVWYNTKAVAKKAARSLKIEQQERSTKQKASAKY